MNRNAPLRTRQPCKAVSSAGSSDNAHALSCGKNTRDSKKTIGGPMIDANVDE